MIKSPLKGSGLKLNVYVAPIAAYTWQNVTLERLELAMTTILSHGRCTS